MLDYPNNCLHCGGVAEVIKGERIATKKPLWKVYCTQCQIRTGPEETRKQAVKVWNKSTFEATP